MRATNLHICARKNCRLKDIRPFDQFGCVGSDDNGVPARRVPTGRAHRPVLTHRDETKGRTKVLRPDPRFRTSALASVKNRESMATLSRQNSRRSVDGPVDMQIALLSQKVKDGSRGSVRVACGVRAIGGGSILQEPLAPYLAGGEEMRNLSSNRARREDARVVENVAVRHRAIDDVILRHCTPARGIRQVVSINGGLDSRAYRLNLPEVSWFDVDLFDVLELKKRLLEKAPEALRAYSIPRVQSVTPVGMDVLADAPHYLRTALEKQGVDFTRPVLYVFEACLYNFEAEKAKTLMRSLPRTKGSVIVATHFQRAMLKWVRDPRHQAEAPYLAELAHHWRSSLEECARKGAFR
jgi:methyltransferase (TIGR00027 family)